MQILEGILNKISPGLPMVGVIVLGILFLYTLKKMLEKHYAGRAEKNLKIQLLMFVLSFVLILVVIIVSPLKDSQQGQLLSLIGIVVSAAIALSSTTFLGNALAGLMLRSVHSFRIGDFVRVGEFFGRVSERGLFHVEIQTEESDLTTLPNLHLVTNPVKVIRSSGTLLWAEVSLGYDVPRTQVQEVLREAAGKVGLQEPFVHIMELRDFSVVYRVAGLLQEVKQIISTRSRLREAMLDQLHLAGIEIASPTIMNQRPVAPGAKFIPKAVREKEPPLVKDLPEDMVFDKAEQAESIEQLRERLVSSGKEVQKLEESLKKTDDENQRQEITSRIERLRKFRERLAEYLKSKDSEAEDGKD